MQARLKNLILATALAAVPLLAVPTPGSAQYGSNPPPAPAPGTVKPAPAPAPAPAPVPAPATVKPAPAPVPAASVVKDSTGGGLITFEAVLVDPTGKAQKKSAAVDVKVAGVSLIDADATDGKPKQGQAHIHYQLDKGPVIATTATKLAFHGLAPGPHTIMVTLAGNDHVPIGRENTLTITIPQ